ncbi:hypothetical protein B0H11DRAFT_1933972 [Mycena galericulata]|nr:hypothetical protein B0H11DRAFT_1933972 [Mycena galericulata]
MGDGKLRYWMRGWQGMLDLETKAIHAASGELRVLGSSVRGSEYRKQPAQSQSELQRKATDVREIQTWPNLGHDRDVTLNLTQRLRCALVELQEITYRTTKTELPSPLSPLPFSNPESGGANFDGYETEPLVDPSFVHAIPQIHTCDRIIAVSGRLFEISSPNSHQHPYYPGPLPPMPDSVGDPFPSDTERRFDGHIGPGDPTLSPQCYNPAEPYLPFIRRDPGDVDFPETPYVKVYDVWIAEPDALWGRLDDDFVGLFKQENEGLNKRIQAIKASSSSRFRNIPRVLVDAPIYPPDSQQVECLRKIRNYDDAVDHVRRLQRLFLKKKAWLDMAEIWDRNPPVCAFYRTKNF